MSQEDPRRVGLIGDVVGVRAVQSQGEPAVLNIHRHLHNARKAHQGLPDVLAALGAVVLPHAELAGQVAVVTGV